MSNLVLIRAEDREFWKEVYVACVSSATCLNSETAASFADQAVKDLRARRTRGLRHSDRN